MILVKYAIVRLKSKVNAQLNSLSNILI